MSDAQKARERALEEAVSRAVRDNLPPLQRTLDELHQAFNDLVSACASAKPSNALPAMLRAQATSASLTASLSVLSTFIANAMQQRERQLEDEEAAGNLRAATVTLPPPEPSRPSPQPSIPTPMAAEAVPAAEIEPAPEQAAASHEESVAEAPAEEAPEEIAFEAETAAEEAAPAEAEFDVASLPKDEQELHRRANRVAKVSMQDIKMLKPEEVRKGRENRDICVRLRSEIDKARREYDRRFQKILDHPVDYFHRWMVDILAGGDAEALGEYPYPSPVLRR